MQHHLHIIYLDVSVASYWSWHRMAFFAKPAGFRGWRMRRCRSQILPGAANGSPQTVGLNGWRFCWLCQMWSISPLMLSSTIPGWSPELLRDSSRQKISFVASSSRSWSYASSRIHTGWWRYEIRLSSLIWSLWPWWCWNAGWCLWLISWRLVLAVTLLKHLPFCALLGWCAFSGQHALQSSSDICPSWWSCWRACCLPADQFSSLSSSCYWWPTSSPLRLQRWVVGPAWKRNCCLAPDIFPLQQHVWICLSWYDMYT